MTQKEIFAIASDEYAINIVREIGEINKNMCYKTDYEQKIAKAVMKNLAKDLIEMINNTDPRRAGKNPAGKGGKNND